MDSHHDKRVQPLNTLFNIISKVFNDTNCEFIELGKADSSWAGESSYLSDDSGYTAADNSASYSGAAYDGYLAKRFANKLEEYGSDNEDLIQKLRNISEICTKVGATHYTNYLNDPIVAEINDLDKLTQ